MEIKKTSQADLENKRTTFFLIGWIVALSSVFVLLEWKSDDTLSPNWEGFSKLYIEQQQLEKEDFPSAFPEALPENTPPSSNQEKAQKHIIYEGFNITETPTEEVSIPELFEESNKEQQKEDFLSSESIQKMREEVVSADPEIMPQYPGGYTELNRFIFNNLKYPASAVSQKKQGRVWCSFIVNKDGSISDIVIEQGVYISLDQEAVRVLQAMPSWIPGTILGKAVRVKVYLPIFFHL
ncbi:MAG: TonB family protein [Candidatus Azobacteroides sp.]|nr:TonB family protein [Candidatus Azobacteroides sp.]